MEIITVAKIVLISQKQDNRLLLLRRSSTDSRRALQWDLPGGKVEPGESLNEAAIRECREETGLKLFPSQLTLVYTKHRVFDDVRPLRSVNWLFFRAYADFPKTTAIELSFEHDDYQWLELEQAIKVIEYPLHIEALKFIQET
jgi:8-oxo-dGTP pyrophosphatase MutT (NUDIX family)